MTTRSNCLIKFRYISNGQWKWTENYFTERHPKNTVSIGIQGHFYYISGSIYGDSWHVDKSLRILLHVFLWIEIFEVYLYIIHGSVYCKQEDYLTYVNNTCFFHCCLQFLQKDGVFQVEIHFVLSFLWHSLLFGLLGVFRKAF